MTREEYYRQCYDAFVKAGGADNSYAEDWVKAVMKVCVDECADRFQIEAINLCGGERSKEIVEIRDKQFRYLVDFEGRR